MNLAKFPRRRYTIGPTPLEFLPRFTETVGGPQIYIKRSGLLPKRSGLLCSEWVLLHQFHVFISYADYGYVFVY